ncbi:LysR substrate-binding domain-containing protein [Salinivibrio sharmensis]|uniref:LysR family transcriptional regulator n=1 Tax=Salinivibrio sharmensis TaxID=390883 RepID=A0ABX3KAM2_9GAMM|nr:LysR substrate-binding domain-containing protein [Salinivibrio sharmensis]OOE85766.1 LysR family transcriptional regulator [Salinivibrio sharmensis]
MALSLPQLRVFLTTVQEGTITAAAKKLFLSKPAVSMALTELESQLGYPLFDRRGNRLHLNDQGAALIPKADELLTRSDEISAALKDDSQLIGCLRLGGSDTVGNQLLPALISDFRHATAHQQQTLVIANSQEIIARLQHFELDIGLIEGEIQHPDLLQTPWLSDQMAVVCHPDHPLASQAPLSVGDLDNQTWLIRESGSGTREHFLSCLAPRFERWHLSFELNTTEAILNAASAGLGLAYLSKLSAQHAIADGRVVALELPLLLSRRYWLVRHKDKYQSGLLTRFWDFCLHWQPQSHAS